MTDDEGMTNAIMAMLKSKNDLIRSPIGRDAIYSSIKATVQEHYPEMDKESRLDKSAQIIGETELMIREIIYNESSRVKNLN